MNIAVFFGGKSCEHNISVATGVTCANALKNTGHNIICVYVTREGKWLSSNRFFDIQTFKSGKKVGSPVFLKCGDDKLYFPLKKVKIDCAVLCNHGKNGEDGSLQGVMQLCKVPYTGSNILGSSIGMDKIYMKRVFQAHKIPCVKFVAAYKHQRLGEIVAIAEKKLPYPMIVKPSNLGSSIGIEVAHNKSELMYALNIAFEWDNSVIVEQALTDFTELNCAVLGDREAVTVSCIERPVSAGEFLSYDEKYHTGGKMNALDRMPNLSEELSGRVKDLAVRSFHACSAEGVARMDFMLDNTNGKLYANEINTIPGSLAHYLFPSLTQTELLLKLIDLAIKRHEADSSLRFAYEDSSFSKKYK